MSAGKAWLHAAMTVRLLIALFALAVTIPYFVLLGENLYSELADEYAVAYRLARVLADSTASDTARFVADTKGLAAHLATRPALHALDTGRCDRFLSDLLPTLQHITNILTVDANGRLLRSATPSLDACGRFLGAVGIDIELTRFRPLRSSEDIPEGTVIKAIIANSEGSLRVPSLAGIDRLIAFRSVRGVD